MAVPQADASMLALSKDGGLFLAFNSGNSFTYPCMSSLFYDYHWIPSMYIAIFVLS